MSLPLVSSQSRKGPRPEQFDVAANDLLPKLTDKWRQGDADKGHADPGHIPCHSASGNTSDAVSCFDMYG